jgi:fatty acid desaturase
MLSFSPSRLFLERGRSRETWAFKRYLDNVWSRGMQYHIGHHFYQRIPLGKMPIVFRELRPILERKGLELGEL